MMNVLANLKGAPHHTPRYFCGDWGSLAAVAGAHCYDVILTAGLHRVVGRAQGGLGVRVEGHRPKATAPTHQHERRSGGEEKEEEAVEGSVHVMDNGRPDGKLNTFEPTEPSARPQKQWGCGDSQRRSVRGSTPEPPRGITPGVAAAAQRGGVTGGRPREPCKRG